MASNYQRMSEELEAMTSEARLFLLTTWWERIPEELEVALLAMVRIMLGELGKLHNSESPESANTD